jgi:ketosteroid isomerase-like protein
MIRSVLGAVAVASLLAGCGSVGGREQAADEVVERWYAAVGAGDGRAACDLLAPDTAKSVAEDTPCADAITDQDLPSPGRVTRTEVFGQRAQVRLDGDTVFLAVFPGGWRVVAAGCASQPGGRPYDCRVEG